MNGPNGEGPYVDGVCVSFPVRGWVYWDHSGWELAVCATWSCVSMVVPLRCPSLWVDKGLFWTVATTSTEVTDTLATALYAGITTPRRILTLAKGSVDGFLGPRACGGTGQTWQRRKKGKRREVLVA